MVFSKNNKIMTSNDNCIRIEDKLQTVGALFFFVHMKVFCLALSRIKSYNCIHSYQQQHHRQQLKIRCHTNSVIVCVLCVCWWLCVRQCKSENFSFSFFGRSRRTIYHPCMCVCVPENCWKRKKVKIHWTDSSRSRSSSSTYCSSILCHTDAHAAATVTVRQQLATHSHTFTKSNTYNCDYVENCSVHSLILHLIYISSDRCFSFPLSLPNGVVLGLKSLHTIYTEQHLAK